MGLIVLMTRSKTTRRAGVKTELGESFGSFMFAPTGESIGVEGIALQGSLGHRHTVRPEVRRTQVLRVSKVLTVHLFRSPRGCSAILQPAK